MTTETTTSTRADLHALVDALPGGELAEARRLLTGLNTRDDPALRAALLAPLEDEELSPEEETMLEKARGTPLAEYVEDDELDRRLGQSGSQT